MNPDGAALYCVHGFHADHTSRGPPLRVCRLSAAEQGASLGLKLTRWERSHGNQILIWMARSVLGNGYAKAHSAAQACPRLWTCSTTAEVRAILNGAPRRIRA